VLLCILFVDLDAGCIADISETITGNVGNTAASRQCHPAETGSTVVLILQTCCQMAKTSVNSILSYVFYRLTLVGSLMLLARQRVSLKYMEVGWTFPSFLCIWIIALSWTGFLEFFRIQKLQLTAIRRSFYSLLSKGKFRQSADSIFSHIIKCVMYECISGCFCLRCSFFLIQHLPVIQLHTILLNIHSLVI
jgi:hypothetical protein